MMYLPHVPIFFEEIMNLFKEGHEDLNEELLFVDMTLGGGGHTSGLLESFPNSKVVSFDQDQEAINNFLHNKFKDRSILVHSNYANLEEELKKIDCFGRVNGVLADLGVSSHQFDEGGRGFSFRFDAPLDMRMNEENELDAVEVVNNYKESDLERIFREYGEERFSKRIASVIVEERRKKRISTTFQLRDLVYFCYPKKMRQGSIHPCTRVFQAIRIEVNQELENLKLSLNQAVAGLKQGGKIAIITFHSLEDRIVKHGFRAMHNDGIIEVLTKKPILPSESEILSNKRARSAKLRIAKKL